VECAGVRIVLGSIKQYTGAWEEKGDPWTDVSCRSSTGKEAAYKLSYVLFNRHETLQA
jgi:hypothetical protein